MNLVEGTKRAIELYRRDSAEGRYVDCMALGMSLRGVYIEVFDNDFPRDLFRASEPEGDIFETMARCIIDDKPYEPPVADVAAG